MRTTRLFTACLGLLIPFLAVAQDAASGPTRAEVKKEGQAATKSGQTNIGDVGTKSPAAGSTSTKSRAEVKAETQDAAKSGQIKSGDLDKASTTNQTHHSKHHKAKAASAPPAQ